MMRRLLYWAGAGTTMAIMALATWQVTQTPATIFKDRVPAPIAVSTHEPEIVAISIQPGEGAEAIANKLERSGVIRSALQLRVLATLEGVENRLGAGEYRFQKGMPVTEVVNLLRRGFTAPRLVTIAEGLRAEEIGDILEEHGAVARQEFLQAMAIDYRDDFDFLRGLPPGATVEGYLFPDTYDLPEAATAEGVVRQMLTNFDRRFGPPLRQAAIQSGLSVFATVTLASIVEREAQVASERPLIAGVFLRRLELAMPLGADPTVQYALANNPQSVALYGYWKRELTADDLQIDSPYNTRLKPGLPPGPIANPGLASLSAVLQPAPTNYLYFVAKPDGSHAFAETLGEHQRNVQRYQGP